MAQRDGWAQTPLFTFSNQTNGCFLSLIPLNSLTQPRSLCFLYTTAWQVYRRVIAAQCLWLHYKVCSCGHIWLNSIMTRSDLWETWVGRAGWECEMLTQEPLLICHDEACSYHFSSLHHLRTQSSLRDGSRSFSRFAIMEGLMERLERAVTRLENLSATMQASSGMANGDCVNGIDGGECISPLWHFNSLFFIVFLSWRFAPCVSRFVSVYWGAWCHTERSAVRLPEQQPSHRQRRGETCKTELLMKCLLAGKQELGAKNDNIPVLSWKSRMNTSVVISAGQNQRITAQAFDSLCVKAAWCQTIAS